ncbi:SPFH domain / Band 7 family protein [Sanguibacter gelidistatuariae]|uniref:SPFH domain / Band 7 family protein n=1 Tax=Sanguibacter gelidistatuariae TaxID=1814289 RepID=A0A1G6GQD4_9MICO|nr:SPFH domain-containing protein [Sanguibacter gelidistatuariae]SDB83935.1 SPFH domain / Band 7 family protein [Sanguibacter gelidistatuariae]
MADIKRYPGIRHFRGSPTRHVIHLSHGTVRNAGTGLSFWYRPLTSVLSELPIDDREIQLMFRARTSDFQDVAVQATLTFRFADPEMASTRLDFSVDPDTGAATTAGLDQVTQILTELAQGHAVDVLAGAPLAAALTEGLRATRQAITVGLAGEERLTTTGLQVLGVRVLSIRPEADVERALRTPAREAIQLEADRATYDRRATAVDMERAIAENELGNKIELATREQQLVVQEGANARRVAQEQAAAEAIRATAAAERTQVTTVADAARIRDIGAAEGERERAAMAAFDGVDRTVLMALALRDLAQNLPAIGQLTVTPDLLTGMLGRLFGGAAAAGEEGDR